jgi:dTMP kinase
VITPALDRGSWVISDRTYYSSIAYQGRARGLGEELVREINEVGLQGTLPRWVFVIEIDVEAALGRQQRPDRIGSESVDFQAAVMRAYRDLVVAEPGRVFLVDGAQSVDDLVDDILEILGDE